MFEQRFFHKVPSGYILNNPWAFGAKEMVCVAAQPILFNFIERTRICITIINGKFCYGSGHNLSSIACLDNGLKLPLKLYRRQL